MSAVRLMFDDLIVSPGERLQSALHRMTQNRRGILFVCDHAYQLLGVLSDGDARRAVSEGAVLLSPVAKFMNIDPITARTLAEAERHLTTHPVLAVPVLDGEGQLRHIMLRTSSGVETLSPSEHDDEPQADHTRRVVQTIAIIPARGSSQRVPRKNLQQVAGRSLLEWSILAATSARNVDYVYVSTDDGEIADIARERGAEVPWLRPAELSTATASIVDVLLHDIRKLRENISSHLEYIVLLEPTAPIRRPGQIDAALELLRTSGADTVVAVTALPHIFHPEEVLAIRNGQVEPYLPDRTMATRRLRGEQTPAYVPSGVLYAARASSVLEHRHLFGRRVVPMETPWEDYLDIDEPADLMVAEIALKRAMTQA